MKLKSTEEIDSALQGMDLQKLVFDLVGVVAKLAGILTALSQGKRELDFIPKEIGNIFFKE